MTAPPKKRQASTDIQNNIMMGKAMVTVVMAAIFATTANAEEREVRQPDGKFSAIEVTKGANLTIEQVKDKTGIEVATDGCPTTDVETYVKDGVLTVRMKKRTPGSAVQVTVFIDDLEKVVVRRGASVETDGTFTRKGKFQLDVGAKCDAKMDIDVEELHVDASTCRIEVEGKATRQQVFVAGTLGGATYDAKELESEDVDIKAVNALAIVNFSGSLKAEAVSGTIKYIGEDAHVTKSGNGLVEREL